MMNKKAITIRFFVRFVFALILVFAALSLLSQCLRLTDKGFEDYKGLIELIKETESGEKRSMALSMDQNTAIVGFSRGDDYSVSRYQFPDSIGMVVLIFEGKHFSACKDKTKSCICLVGEPEFDRTGDYSAGFPSKKWAHNYYKPEDGSELYCQELDNTFLSFDCNVVNMPEDGFSCSHGFILERGMARVEDYDAHFDGSRTKAIYVAKKTIGDKSTVAVCLDPDCEVKTLYDEANELYSQQSFNAALAKYLSFVDEYDQGVEVEKSLLRIGFIYKEPLNMPPKAREFYNRLLTDFPESQFRENAESALESLGSS